MLAACNTFEFCYFLSEKEKYDDSGLKDIENTTSFILKVLQITPIFDKFKLEDYDQEKIKKIFYKLQSILSANDFDVIITHYYLL